MNDINFIRGAVAVHAKRSVFALISLAGNIDLRVHQLEAFLRGKDLPPDALPRLVDELFYGKKIWDAEAQVLLDVVKPASAMPDTSKLPHGVANTGL